MMLIADSGSTKTSWCLTHDDGSCDTCVTSGINPFHIGQNEIVRLLNAEFSINKTDVTKICFYGAGCASEQQQQILKKSLAAYFGNVVSQVYSDLLAAAHALCGWSQGIACILGTGSNSCVYDGQAIMRHVSPLGFILGDEGSGADLGKRLLNGIFKQQFATSVHDAFFAAHPQSVTEMLEHVYRKPFPSRYLAQYVPFIAAHIGFPDMAELVRDSFLDFFGKNVMLYPEAKHLPVHFTGGVAFIFGEQLRKAANSLGLTVGNIIRDPMPALIEYHRNAADL
ncbi:MAG: ATPase [Bacteroidales bacterium]|jgi:N-acetylglucosamine kinase-like BadF-type ATPase|nr:ATPase [Bacteroidales bacterium]